PPPPRSRPRPVTLAGLAAADKVYDGNTAAVLSGGTLQGLVGSETLGLTVGGRFDTKDVGNDKAVIVDAGVADGTNGGRAANYRLAELAPVRADITPATLVYTADPASKVVGAPLPALSGSVSGFVAGETQAGATTGSLRFTTPATATSPAGAYAVDGGGLSATNYVFTQAPGNATALTVVGLPPQQTDPGARVAVARSVERVTLPPLGSSPADGRVLDVLQALRGAGLGDGALFAPIPVGELTEAQLTTLLAARDRYKKALFEVSLRRLESDPGLADLPACQSAKEVDNGTCLITEDLKKQLQAERAGVQVAQGQAPAPAPAAAPAPAPAAASPAPAPATPAAAPSPAPAPAPSAAPAPAP
ncbi:MBG domain-containing protein, partial [Piscinibacter sakaiensis]|uniref:MBG domain-containing protein n=1 Tax=Piscinibacter sakaiensis TaxID=1547922 RepID=UPI000A3DE6AB